MVRTKECRGTTVQSEKQLVAAPLLGAVRVTAILLAITPSVALGTQDTLHHTIYRSIDYPGAVSTLVSSVDNNGDLAGLYSDSAGKKHILALINGSLIAIPCAEALGLPIIVSQSGAVYVYYSGNPPVRLSMRTMLRPRPAKVRNTRDCPRRYPAQMSNGEQSEMARAAQLRRATPPGSRRRFRPQDICESPAGSSSPSMCRMRNTACIRWASTTRM